MRSGTTVAEYVIISPVKDEEQYIEFTLRSVTAQTLLPALWVIVDDGSTDRTPDIVREYQARFPFIRLVSHHRDGMRHPGSRVIHAFNRGREAVGQTQYDFIVKLDCDLSFGPDYFERLLDRFDDNSTLGIASGVYLELDDAKGWSIVTMPSYHAFGACKAVRRECFEHIHGFITVPGWDTVDEIRAWRTGWETCHFVDLETKHHKPEGSGIGRVKTGRMHGEIYYRTGGDPIFLLFKILHRITKPPIVIGAFALAQGYCSALLTRKSLLVTNAEARHYRRTLRQRLIGRSKTSLALLGLPSGH